MSIVSKRTLTATLIALSILALIGGALLLWSDRNDGAPSQPAAELTREEAFVPAEVVEAQPEAPAEAEQAEAPAEPVEQVEEGLPEEEQLSEEALELAYKLDDLHQGAGRKKPKKLRPAVLIVVTNFDQADVTINGLSYPEYYEDPKEEGMVLPAGGPYDVRVSYGGNSKAYTISLRPYETRYLVVELSGMKGGAAPPPARPRATPKPKPAAEEEASDEKEGGRVTVYSKPRGDILIDGKDVGKRTPNTAEAPEGRHEVQVRYEDGAISEKKIIRVRKGSRIKLFFRQRKK